MLDDHIIKTLAMRGSAFVKPFEVEVRNWYDQLMRVNRIFDEWMRVQNKWLYLLPILSSDRDIATELPDEQQLFIKVNEIYCKYVHVRCCANNLFRVHESESFVHYLSLHGITQTHSIDSTPADGYQ